MVESLPEIPISKTFPLPQREDELDTSIELYNNENNDSKDKELIEREEIEKKTATVINSIL